jgi:hypothetical protein
MVGRYHRAQAASPKHFVKIGCKSSLLTVLGLSRETADSLWLNVLAVAAGAAPARVILPVQIFALAAAVEVEAGAIGLYSLLRICLRL